MDYKLIYLAKRNPTIAAADFGEAWTSHARFAGQFADSFIVHFKSARQCVKLHEADVPPTFRNDHDGVALLGMQSWDSLNAARFHPIAFDELKRDEERVFADYVDKWTMPTEEYHVLKRGGGKAFILSFLKRPEDVADDIFQQRLSDACEAVATLPALHGMTRLVRNRVLEPRDPPYDFSAVLELWFATEQDVLVAARDAGVIAAVEQAEIADVGAGVRMIARLNMPS